MTDLEKELLELVKGLRAENSALVELQLMQASVPNPHEIESKIEIPSTQRYRGRMPWYLLRTKLEQVHRKPKLSEISGIPDDSVATATETDEGIDWPGNENELDKIEDKSDAS